MGVSKQKQTRNLFLLLKNNHQITSKRMHNGNETANTNLATGICEGTVVFIFQAVEKGTDGRA